MNQDVRVAIIGASGRMGRQLITTTVHTKGVLLGAAIVRKGSSFCGKDAGELAKYDNLGVSITDDLKLVINDFDILIDFTHQDRTLKNLELCLQYHKPMVIGTTGLDKKSQELIKESAQEIALVYSANFSIGINLLLKLVEKTTKVIGSDYDIEIIEAHHRHKSDSPSGTAQKIAATISNEMNWNVEPHSLHAGPDINGSRTKNTIGLSSLRAGDIIGDHTVMFANIGERIEISHKASNRIIFAKGALKAAKWLRTYKTGFFDMIDVLNLHDI
ncbi:4-hydroxy-tetrahydrodipicolinate reductase [Candidatus Erwinia haradaeae]|uniref:4-hydroxy-tetrahydrodipicolinate reductase n=1 Tax=Candidatus Erwinia haradaeae TaxID=1922217 RepID=A0A451D8C9_9GAMM|nr:4-hydroxy-tetrahydrodipicolinate reductase [Candidatus Erwinia haradaeae]VFP82082.1 4-hydroxy-tetrahydrodipicolinate reductase [Candidatus Erwinia haradaeae]